MALNLTLSLIRGLEYINDKTPVIAIANKTDNIHQVMAGVDEYIAGPLSAAQ
ncbi:MAG: hypothetical protein PHY16_09105 [Methylobacter sp.]|nr:hypothetical protein [Methylobacter sp.]